MITRKRFFIYIMAVSLGLFMSVAFAELSDYVLPKPVKAEKVEDFYGIWRNTYIVDSDSNKAYSIEEYLDVIQSQGQRTMNMDGREYLIDELGSDYCFVIGSNNGSDIYSFDMWGPYVGEGLSHHRFEDGHLIVLDLEGKDVAYLDLLEDGTLCYSDLDGGGSKQVLVCQSFASSKNKKEGPTGEIIQVTPNFDLDGLSYSNLIDLKEQINLAMWQCEEWQEVTVPQGLWEVGKDIPEGHWTVRCATDAYAEVYYGDTIAPDGKSLKITTRFVHEEVVSPEFRTYEEGKDLVDFSFEVRKGDYIVIDRSSVIFTPFSGKPDLGFK